MGDGGGGGISVPSVKEPNLKSRAGSSNRPEVGEDGVVATPSARFFAGMVETWEPEMQGTDVDGIGREDVCFGWSKTRECLC